jgi:hypothetical protein
VRSGAFINTLNNVTQALKGGEAGKTNGPLNFMSNVPIGQIISMAAFSNDGMFAMFLSDRIAHTTIWACLNPLGDPGDPSKPINPGFFVPPGSLVQCMAVGDSALRVNLSAAFGPDNQPYVGGQRITNTFNAIPGGPVASAWPQCIYRNDGAVPFPFTRYPRPTVAQLQANLQFEFARHFENLCGSMTANSAGTSALITQPADIKVHKGTPYMYETALGGTVVQYKVTQNPITGFSQYQFRTYVTGTSLATGLGIADDLKSLIVMTDPTAVGLAAQEVMTKLPLCEDM